MAATRLETALLYTGVAYPDAEPEVTIYRRPSVIDTTYTEVRSWGVLTTGKRPCFVWFRGDLYNIGGFSRPLVRHRVDARWLPAGLKSSNATLVVVEGSGSGGSSGEALCYITLLHKQGELLLAESNRSNIVQLTGQTGKGYDWTLPDKSAAEVRATHVRGYRSMNGGSFRKAFEVPLGTPSFTENVETNLLLQEGPGSSHYPPPNGTAYGEKAFGRMWYARTSEHPYRLWGSAAGDPQYVPLTNFRDTSDREPITAIAKSRDATIIFSLTSAYLLRQYGGGAFDFTLQKLDSAVGCTSHWGVKEIHNKLIFPAQDGVWMYDGGFRYLMSDIRNFWSADYESDRLPFLDSFAMDHKRDKNYVLFTPRPDKPLFEGQTVGTVAYIGNYLHSEPSIGGQNSQPDWSVDVADRTAESALYSSVGEVLVAWDDGEIRIEDDTDPDDDGDALQKHLTAVGPHLTFQDEGDDVESGKTFSPLWVFVESELTAFIVRLMGGDEAAAKQQLPDNALYWFRKTVAATETWGLMTIEGVTYIAKSIAKSVHFIQSDQVTGRGMAVRFDADAPIGLKIRGYGGMYGPAAATRPRELVSPSTASDIDSFPQVDDGGWQNFPQTKAAGMWPIRVNAQDLGNLVEAPVFITHEILQPDGVILTFNEKFDVWTRSSSNFSSGVTVNFTQSGAHTITSYAVDKNGLGGADSGVLTIS